MGKRVLLLAVLGSVAALCALGVRQSVLEEPSAERLRAAADGADRLVVRPQWAPVNDSPADVPPVEIVGAGVIEELWDLLEWTPPELPPGGVTFVRCGCDGEFHLDFYKGKKLLLSLGYHHNQLLRWRNGPWKTDVRLTEGAKSSVPAWFKRHGFPVMEKLYEERRRKEEAERPTK